MRAPDRTTLAPGLEISRMVTGLWQVADQERSGTPLDPERGADALQGYAEAGFDTFDMADHYGSAEIIAGRLLARPPAGRRPLAFTKWCPEPGPMTREVVRGGVERALRRLGVERIDLLQLHWWTFEHLAYVDALIELDRLRQDGLVAHLGVTNFDTGHLSLAIRHGIPIVSNQVSFSVLDRRASGAMSAFCAESGVALLAYGTLAGGLLSERWLGVPEPQPGALIDWSKMKYSRFVAAIGGWDVFQAILEALDAVARRHGVGIANVASRWVLDQPAVAGIIVGARLGEGEHREDNLKTFTIVFDDEDRAQLDSAFREATPLPGDCGDEYRKPPFLTASGDLGHHLATVPPYFKATAVPGRSSRLRVDSGSLWEPIAGYSRAVKADGRILVSGTTATHGSGLAVCPDDPAGQTTYILDKIAASLAALGGTLDDVLRTRIFLADADDWEPVSRVHGRYFGATRPANTLLEVGRLVGGYRVEIEAEAVVG